MTLEHFQAIESHGGAVLLRDRTVLRLTGGDRVRFLNGQITNDAAKATPQRSLYACVTDLKGKIFADVFIHAAADGASLLLDAEPALRESLAARLERYIIADDVLLTDETERWQIWHVFGPAGAAPSTPPSQSPTLNKDCGLESNRLGKMGHDVWLERATAVPDFGVPILSADDFETLRILRGVPRFPHELNAETFPPEAGLEARAMSFTKGCYIGQEILSRIKTTGKMPRQLVHVEAGTAAGLAAGDAIFAPGEGKPVGILTSVTLHPATRREVALGFVRQAAADSELLARPGTATVALHRIHS